MVADRSFGREMKHFMVKAASEIKKTLIKHVNLTLYTLAYPPLCHPNWIQLIVEKPCLTERPEGAAL